jgi:hypothetical protein
MILLTEELALLVFDDDRGLPDALVHTALPHALAATLILDLVAAGDAELGEGGEVAAIGSGPADPLLREAWTSIRSDTKVRHLRDWVSKSTRLVAHLPTPVYEHLTAGGVLEHDGTKTLFHHDRYRELDGRLGADLAASLGEALDGTRPATGDDVVLLGVLRSMRMVPKLFPGRDHHATDARIKALLADDGGAADVAVGVSRAVAAVVAGAVGAAVVGGAS